MTLNDSSSYFPPPSVSLGYKQKTQKNRLHEHSHKGRWRRFKSKNTTFKTTSTPSLKSRKLSLEEKSILKITESVSVKVNINEFNKLVRKGSSIMNRYIRNYATTTNKPTKIEILKPKAAYKHLIASRTPYVPYANVKRDLIAFEPGHMISNLFEQIVLSKVLHDKHINANTTCHPDLLADWSEGKEGDMSVLFWEWAEELNLNSLARVGLLKSINNEVLNYHKVTSVGTIVKTGDEFVYSVGTNHAPMTNYKVVKCSCCGNLNVTKNWEKAEDFLEVVCTHCLSYCGSIEHFTDQQYHDIETKISGNPGSVAVNKLNADKAVIDRLSNVHNAAKHICVPPNIKTSIGKLINTQTANLSYFEMGSLTHNADLMDVQLNLIFAKLPLHSRIELEVVGYLPHFCKLRASNKTGHPWLISGANPIYADDNLDTTTTVLSLMDSGLTKHQLVLMVEKYGVDFIVTPNIMGLKRDPFNCRVIELDDVYHVSLPSQTIAYSTLKETLPLFTIGGNVVSSDQNDLYNFELVTSNSMFSLISVTSTPLHSSQNYVRVIKRSEVVVNLIHSEWKPAHDCFLESNTIITVDRELWNVLMYKTSQGAISISEIGSFLNLAMRHLAKNGNPHNMEQTKLHHYELCRYLSLTSQAREFKNHIDDLLNRDVLDLSGLVTKVLFGFMKLPIKGMTDDSIEDKFKNKAHQYLHFLEIVLKARERYMADINPAHIEIQFPVIQTGIPTMLGETDKSLDQLISDAIQSSYSTCVTCYATVSFNRDHICDSSHASLEPVIVELLEPQPTTLQMDDPSENTEFENSHDSFESATDLETPTNKSQEVKNKNTNYDNVKLLEPLKTLGKINSKDKNRQQINNTLPPAPDPTLALMLDADLNPLMIHELRRKTNQVSNIFVSQWMQTIANYEFPTSREPIKAPIVTLLVNSLPYDGYILQVNTKETMELINPPGYPQDGKNCGWIALDCIHMLQKGTPLPREGTYTGVSDDFELSESARQLGLNVIFSSTVDNRFIFAIGNSSSNAFNIIVQVAGEASDIGHFMVAKTMNLSNSKFSSDSIIPVITLDYSIRYFDLPTKLPWHQKLKRTWEELLLRTGKNSDTCKIKFVYPTDDGNICITNNKWNKTNNALKLFSLRQTDKAKSKFIYELITNTISREDEFGIRNANLYDASFREAASILSVFLFSSKSPFSGDVKVPLVTLDPTGNHDSDSPLEIIRDETGNIYSSNTQVVSNNSVQKFFKAKHSIKYSIMRLFTASAPIEKIVFKRFIGAPGTGKTYQVTKQLAKEIDAGKVSYMCDVPELLRETAAKFPKLRTGTSNYFMQYKVKTPYLIVDEASMFSKEDLELVIDSIVETVYIVGDKHQIGMITQTINAKENLLTFDATEETELTKNYRVSNNVLKLLNLPQNSVVEDQTKLVVKNLKKLSPDELQQIAEDRIVIVFQQKEKLKYSNLGLKVMTAHESQGCNFTKVLVICDNNPNERNANHSYAHFLVACTRASQDLMVIAANPKNLPTLGLSGKLQSLVHDVVQNKQSQTILDTIKNQISDVKGGFLNFLSNFSLSSEDENQLLRSKPIILKRSNPRDKHLKPFFLNSIDWQQNVIQSRPNPLSDKFSKYRKRSFLVGNKVIIERTLLGNYEINSLQEAIKHVGLNYSTVEDGDQHSSSELLTKQPMSAETLSRMIYEMSTDVPIVFKKIEHVSSTSSVVTFAKCWTVTFTNVPDGRCSVTANSDYVFKLISKDPSASVLFDIEADHSNTIVVANLPWMRIKFRYLVRLLDPHNLGISINVENTNYLISGQDGCDLKSGLTILNDETNQFVKMKHGYTQFFKTSLVHNYSKDSYAYEDFYNVFSELLRICVNLNLYKTSTLIGHILATAINFCPQKLKSICLNENACRPVYYSATNRKVIEESNDIALLPLTGYSDLRNGIHKSKNGHVIYHQFEKRLVFINFQESVKQQKIVFKHGLDTSPTNISEDLMHLAQSKKLCDKVYLPIEDTNLQMSLFPLVQHVVRTQALIYNPVRDSHLNFAYYIKHSQMHVIAHSGICQAAFCATGQLSPKLIGQPLGNQWAQRQWDQEFCRLVYDTDNSISRGYNLRAATLSQLLKDNQGVQLSNKSPIHFIDYTQCTEQLNIEDLTTLVCGFSGLTMVSMPTKSLNKFNPDYDIMTTNTTKITVHQSWVNLFNNIQVIGCGADDNSLFTFQLYSDDEVTVFGVKVLSMAATLQVSLFSCDVHRDSKGVLISYNNAGMPKSPVLLKDLPLHVYTALTENIISPTLTLSSYLNKMQTKSNSVYITKDDQSKWLLQEMSNYTNDESLLIGLYNIFHGNRLLKQVDELIEELQLNNVNNFSATTKAFTSLINLATKHSLYGVVDFIREIGNSVQITDMTNVIQRDPANDKDLKIVNSHVVNKLRPLKYSSYKTSPNKQNYLTRMPNSDTLTTIANLFTDPNYKFSYYANQRPTVSTLEIATWIQLEEDTKTIDINYLIEYKYAEHKFSKATEMLWVTHVLEFQNRPTQKLQHKSSKFSNITIEELAASKSIDNSTDDSKSIEINQEGTTDSPSNSEDSWGQLDASQILTSDNLFEESPKIDEMLPPRPHNTTDSPLAESSEPTTWAAKAASNLHVGPKNTNSNVTLESEIIVEQQKTPVNESLEIQNQKQERKHNQKPKMQNIKQRQNGPKHVKETQQKSTALDNDILPRIKVNILSSSEQSPTTNSTPSEPSSQNSKVSTSTTGPNRRTKLVRKEITLKDIIAAEQQVKPNQLVNQIDLKKTYSNVKDKLHRSMETTDIYAICSGDQRDLISAKIKQSPTTTNLPNSSASQMFNVNNHKCVKVSNRIIFPEGADEDVAELMLHFTICGGCERALRENVVFIYKPRPDLIEACENCAKTVESVNGIDDNETQNKNPANYRSLNALIGTINQIVENEMDSGDKCLFTELNIKKTNNAKKLTINFDPRFASAGKGGEFAQASDFTERSFDRSFTYHLIDKQETQIHANLDEGTCAICAIRYIGGNLSKLRNDNENMVDTYGQFGTVSLKIGPETREELVHDNFVLVANGSTGDLRPMAILANYLVSLGKEVHMVVGAGMRDIKNLNPKVDVNMFIGLDSSSMTPIMSGAVTQLSYSARSAIEQNETSAKTFMQVFNPWFNLPLRERPLVITTAICPLVIKHCMDNNWLHVVTMPYIFTMMFNWAGLVGNPFKDIYPGNLSNETLPHFWSCDHRLSTTWNGEDYSYDTHNMVGPLSDYASTIVKKEKLVVFCCGSCMIPEEYLGHFIRVAKLFKARGFEIQIVSGWNGDLPEELTSLTPNEVQKYANYRKVFPRAMFVVHHCGAGTTHDAFYYNCYSIGHTYFGDMPWWLKKLEALGMGKLVTEFTMDHLDEWVTKLQGKLRHLNVEHFSHKLVPMINSVTKWKTDYHLALVEKTSLEFDPSEDGYCVSACLKHIHLTTFLQPWHKVAGKEVGLENIFDFFLDYKVPKFNLLFGKLALWFGEEFPTLAIADKHCMVVQVDVEDVKLFTRKVDTYNTTYRTYETIKHNFNETSHFTAIGMSVTDNIFLFNHPSNAHNKFTYYIDIRNLTENLPRLGNINYTVSKVLKPEIYDRSHGFRVYTGCQYNYFVTTDMENKHLKRTNKITCQDGYIIQNRNSNEKIAPLKAILKGTYLDEYSLYEYPNLLLPPNYSSYTTFDLPKQWQEVEVEDLNLSQEIHALDDVFVVYWCSGMQLIALTGNGDRLETTPKQSSAVETTENTVSLNGISDQIDNLKTPKNETDVGAKESNLHCMTKPSQEGEDNELNLADDSALPLNQLENSEKGICESSLESGTENVEDDDSSTLSSSEEFQELSFQLPPTNGANLDPAIGAGLKMVPMPLVAVSEPDNTSNYRKPQLNTLNLDTQQKLLPIIDTMQTAWYQSSTASEHVPLELALNLIHNSSNLEGNSIISTEYLTMTSDEIFLHQSSSNIEYETDFYNWLYWNDFDRVDLVIPEPELGLKRVLFNKWDAYETTQSFDLEVPCPSQSRTVISDAYNSSLQGFIARNGSVIKVRTELIPAERRLSDFINTYFDEKMMPIADSVSVQDQDVLDWVNNHHNPKRIAHEILDKARFHPMNWMLNQVNVHSKKESLLKSKVIFDKTEQRSRVIVWQPYWVSALYSPLFMKIKFIFKKVLREKFLYTDGMTINEVNTWLKDKAKTKIYLEDDLSKQDRQTDRNLLDWETAIYIALGLSKIDALQYRSSHDQWLASGSKFKAVGHEQRLTGQPTTSLGNALVTLIIRAHYIELNYDKLSFFCFIGDDAAIGFSETPSLEDYDLHLSQCWNQQSKMSLSNLGGNFCNFLYSCEHNLFTPNLLRLVERFTISNSENRYNCSTRSQRVLSYCHQLWGFSSFQKLAYKICPSISPNPMDPELCLEINAQLHGVSLAELLHKLDQLYTMMVNDTIFIHEVDIDKEFKWAHGKMRNMNK